ncbi:MAG: HEPN domain-containing protein [Acidobacteria bacterium]|nr:HEPN domain-containing protein [Acidobacteriota bacterium]
MSELPLTRKDFQRLADLRAKEAGVLTRNGCEEGAYYLAGYAAECALKACIAKKTKRHEFPPKRKYVEDVYSHKLETLLGLAELKEQLEDDTRKNSGLAANWAVVKSWSEESRYVTSGLKGKDLYTAITGADGVLAWIKQRW